MTGRAPSIGAVVVRVSDLPRMTAFWSAALDYVPRYPPGDDWVALGPREGADGVNLSLDLHRSEYGLPPRFHLDLYAEDRDAEVRRLVDLGASVVPLDHAEPVDWVLLEDPEGNRFDLIQLPPADDAA